MKRFLWLGFVLFVYVICSGCGDTFRPIIVPNPPTFPNPRATHTAVSINDNGTFTPGSAMVIDVAGDADVSVADVDIHPVHAVQQTANQVLVVNQAATHLDQPALPLPTTTCLVTFTPPPPLPSQVYNVCPSLEKLNFNGTVIASKSSVSLPPYSGASFVAAAPSDTLAYVTMPTFPPDPTQPLTIVPSVGVINTQSNTLTSPLIPVGKNPVALAVTPDKAKLYVANEGDSTIKGFNTVDRSPRVVSPANTTLPPVSLVARTDNQRVFVLEANAGGTASSFASIDTTSTANTDVLTEYPSISVPGATTMVYDSNLNRLYIPGGPVLKIVDVSQSTPQLLATISIPMVASVPPVQADAVAVTALPDGTRAYVTSVPGTAQPSQVSISGVQGDGTTATFTYTLAAGHNPTPGITVVVSGIAMPNDGFNGTYAINSVLCDQLTQICTFRADSATVLATQTAVTGVALSTIDNLFPQVTVVDVNSNQAGSTFDIPGFPDATNSGNPAYFVPVCVTARFRFIMAAGGDSSRAYLAACDSGSVNIIDTSNNTPIVELLEPIGSRLPIPPSNFNPPQNPIFLFAGP